MSYDIYGNVLKRGHCEVHPDINEPYPCSYCYEELQRNVYEQQENDYVREMENRYIIDMTCQFVSDMFGISDIKLLTYNPTGTKPKI